MSLPKAKGGQPIFDGDFNRLIDIANSCNLTVGQGSGLNLQSGPDGYVLSTSVAMPFWAKITGAISSGQYPFTQQYEATGGTWTAAPLTGTAFEITGNTSVAANTYVKMWRSAAGDYRFLAGSC